MLQGAGCHGELQGLALCSLRQQAVNQAAGEAVATTYAVDDGVNVVALALVELLAVEDKGLPAVVRGREALAQRGDDILEAELLAHLTEDAFVAGSVGLAALNIGVGLETKAELCILFVADADVYILHQRAHNADGLLARPQLLAEVEVHAHGDTVTLGSLAGQARQLSSLVADGGRDTAPVEPVGTLHDLVEVEVSGHRLGDGAVCTVVDDLRGAHRGTRLSIVQPHAVATTGDEAGIYAIAAHGIHGNLANLMLGQLRHEVSLVAVVGQRDSHIGFTAAGDDTERFTLNETVVAVGRKAKHQFAKGYNL